VCACGVLIDNRVVCGAGLSRSFTWEYPQRTFLTVDLKDRIFFIIIIVIGGFGKIIATDVDDVTGGRR